MKEWDRIIRELKEPFPANEIKWRVGKVSKSGKKGLALAYIDSRAVMDRLDNVVGPDRWQRKHSFGRNGEVLCSIGIKINDEWVWKTDGAAQTNFEAEKGGLSDAFKRAAVSWGIGRYLYHLPTKWVALDKYKNIKNPPQLPKEALPQKNRMSEKKEQQKKRGKKANKNTKKQPEEYKKLKRELWNKLKGMGFDKEEVQIILHEAFDTLELAKQDIERAIKDFDEVKCDRLLKDGLKHRKQELFNNES